MLQIMLNIAFQVIATYPEVPTKYSGVLQVIATYPKLLVLTKYSGVSR